MTLSPVAQQRIVQGSSATLEVWFTDQDGEPAAAADDVTLGITRGDGTELVAAATAATPADEIGRYTYTLATTGTQLLDLLTATWTDGTTTHSTLVEVVGGVYFTVAEARARITSLSIDTYSSEEIVAARRDVEDEFERICGCAFVPRYAKDTVRTRGGCSVVLDQPLVRTIRSVTSTTSTFSDGQLAAIVIVQDNLGWIELSTGYWPTTSSTVEYEHGFDRPPPEIKVAAFTRLRERLNFDRGGIPDRATSFTMTEGGAFRLDQAGEDKTGNPEIDAALARHRKNKPLLVR